MVRSVVLRCSSNGILKIFLLLAPEKWQEQSLHLVAIQQEFLVFLLDGSKNK